MKVNESEIYRCGFSKIPFYSKSIEAGDLLQRVEHLKIKEVFGDEYFHLYVEEYDSHLEGFIDKDISIYKCKGYRGKHQWVCRVDLGEPFIINKIGDILDISPEISYNKKIGFVYIIHSPDFGYKIGSTRSIHQRKCYF
jgi:hypothetical protein